MSPISVLIYVDLAFGWTVDTKQKRWRAPRTTNLHNPFTVKVMDFPLPCCSVIPVLTAGGQAAGLKDGAVVHVFWGMEDERDERA